MSLPPARAPAAAALLGALLGLASCGGEPPSITGLEWRVERRPTARPAAATAESPKNAWHESLSVFTALRDPDGLEDIETLWILNDEAELSWRLDAASWTRRSEGGEEWFGAADLVMPDFAPIPAGPWRALVADLAGRRSERSFRVEEAPSPPPPPELLRENGILTLRSTWPESFLLGYDAAGVLVRASATRAGRVDPASVLGTADAGKSLSLAAYGYDPAARRGAWSGRIATR